MVGSASSEGVFIVRIDNCVGEQALDCVTISSLLNRLDLIKF